MIIELICSDLKFKDKHTDEQYVLLNSKLKTANKMKKLIMKIGKRSKTVKPKHKDRTRKASKFSNKYKDRIISIKDSDKTRQENLKKSKNSEKLTNKLETKEKEEFLKDTYKKI